MTTTFSNPPFSGNGAAYVRIDGQGKLLAVKRLLPVPQDPTSRPPDWPALFRGAGLDIAEFRPVPPKRDWTIPHDRRFAWEGVYAERPNIPLTVEAATVGQEVVAFVLVAPWTLDETAVAENSPSEPIWFWLSAVVLPLSCWLTFRNIRSGTADIRGAIRFGEGYAIIRLALESWFAVTKMSAGMSVFDFTVQVGLILLNSLWLLTAYAAFEPFVRRRFPKQLTGWQRLLAGRVRSPHLGREVLLGVACGALLLIVATSPIFIQKWFGGDEVLTGSTMEVISDPINHALVVLVDAINLAIFLHLAFSILTWLLRSPWVSILVILSFMVVVILLVGRIADTVTLLFVAMAVIGGVLFTLTRYGLVALMSLLYSMMVGGLVMLEGFDTPFWPAPVVGWTVLLALTGYGLVVSVGGWRRLVWGEKAG